MSRSPPGKKICPPFNHPKAIQDELHAINKYQQNDAEEPRVKELFAI